MAQKLYEGWAQSRTAKDSLASVLQLLCQPLPPDCDLPTPDPLPLKRSLCFESVYFRYGSDLPDVLQGLNLEIHRGERIGLVGSTGSGKSTTVDLLMGLLVPTGGRLIVDEQDLHDPQYPERLAAWRAGIAHVPQSIYLADCSIAENIAFGIPEHEIDLEKVRAAAAQAQIAGFIENTKHGYSSFVGERGIRLSGGQRQRIGIARALYKSARLLVFDEATSALDNQTESSVMEEVKSLSSEITILMIAHRLSTLEHCDRVLRLEDGLVLSA